MKVGVTTVRVPVVVAVCVPEVPVTVNEYCPAATLLATDMLRLLP